MLTRRACPSLFVPLIMWTSSRPNLTRTTIDVNRIWRRAPRSLNTRNAFLGHLSPKKAVDISACPCPAYVQAYLRNHDNWRNYHLLSISYQQ